MHITTHSYTAVLMYTVDYMVLHIKEYCIVYRKCSM